MTRCLHRPGGCPLCDPRPISADRAVGCVCPPGKPVPLHLDDWKPAARCPVHFDDPEPLQADQVDELFAGRAVQLDVDPELEVVLAALYGPTWRAQLTEHLAEQYAEQLAGEQTPDPVRHPPEHGEGAGAGGRVGTSLEAPG